MSAAEPAVDPAGCELLELDRVSLAYGETVVVREVSLRIRSGEVLAIMGPNGAGKTTLLNGIVGLASVARGSVRFRGQPMRRMNPSRAAAAGIAYVPQGRWLFPYASGAMNLWSGGYRRRDRAALERELREFTAQWPVAQRVASRNAIVMSGGEQQVIAIGRGLMARPRLLLIDEPSLGLAPILVKEVFELIGRIASGLAGGGAGVIVVEQNVEAARSVADHVCILSGGRVVHESAKEAVSAAEIGELYLR